MTGAKNIIKKNAAIAIYNEKKKLYLEKMHWDRIWFSRSEPPDSAVLCPTAFVRKALQVQRPATTT